MLGVNAGTKCGGVHPLDDQNSGPLLKQSETSFDKLVSPSGNFEVYYTTDVSSPHRVSTLDLDANNIPDMVESTAFLFDSAYSQYVVQQGYKKPLTCNYTSPLGNKARNGRYLVELADLGSLGEYESPGAFGLTFSCQDGGSMVMIENDFYCPNCIPSTDMVTYGFYPPEVLHNYRQEWYAGLKVTVFHEFYHAVQFSENQPMEHFWTEASAVAFEEFSAPDVNDYFQYAARVFAIPDEPLYLQNGIREYSSGLWALFIMQKFGPEVLKIIWQSISEYGDVLQAIDAAFRNLGTSLETEWKNYCLQLAQVGGGIKKGIFSDAALFPRVMPGHGLNSGETLSFDYLPMSFRKITIPQHTSEIKLTGTANIYLLEADHNFQKTRVTEFSRYDPLNPADSLLLHAESQYPIRSLFVIHGPVSPGKIELKMPQSLSLQNELNAIGWKISGKSFDYYWKSGDNTIPIVYEPSMVQKKISPVTGLTAVYFNVSDSLWTSAGRKLSLIKGNGIEWSSNETVHSYSIEKGWQMLESQTYTGSELQMTVVKQGLYAVYFNEASSGNLSFTKETEKDKKKSLLFNVLGRASSPNNTINLLFPE